MGKDALPFVMEKLENGVFLLNQAVLDIVGLKLEDIMGSNIKFPGEKKKSAAILKWWKSKQPVKGSPLISL